MTKDSSGPGDHVRNHDFSPDGSTTPEPQSHSRLINIAEHGDVILKTRTKVESEPSLFRVDGERLKAVSPFFRALLGSHFKEGTCVRNGHERILEDGGQPSQAPAARLPQISLAELGHAWQPTDLNSVMADLLRILHEQDISYSRPGIRYLAYLATLADQYNCLPAVTDFVDRKRFLQMLDKKTKGSTGAEVSEEHLRQKVLVGWLLDYPPWLITCSQKLIMRGSSRWGEDEGSAEAKQSLWWDLPDDLEVELQARRELILETINCLQQDLLSRYTSKRLQCALGYSNSPQCDSFQLGEAIRFLSRIGTIKVQGLIYDTHVGEPNARSIYEIISTLRQCPSYQIDQHHTHCGMRTKLVPALQFIQFALDYGVGICGACWKHDRPNCRWSNVPAAGKWIMPTSCAEWLSTRRPTSCKEYDAKVKAFFTASTREWP